MFLSVANERCDVVDEVSNGSRKVYITRISGLGSWCLGFECQSEPFDERNIVGLRFGALGIQRCKGSFQKLGQSAQSCGN